MIARFLSLGIRGIEGYPVSVELDMANGLPGYSTVGLPDSAVRESRERVLSAVRNSGFRLPSKRITVNLAPAEARKEGAHFDLPIALALISASGQIPVATRDEKYCFVGELALDGSLRPIKGVLSMAMEAKARGYQALIVPRQNMQEALACGGLRVWGAVSLREVAEFLSGEGQPLASAEPWRRDAVLAQACVEDMADVKGQSLAKRALEIAAAGGHNALLVGPPGAGKSMLARRLPGLLPPLGEKEALEVIRIHSLARAEAAEGLCLARPFRAPHHTVSTAALVGGGPSARPGEISMAHGGVLFLDEVAEFNRQALEALRQPLEEGKIVVSRARENNEYPARFLLVAATNPCPCGWLGHPRRECRCSPALRERYFSKLSGPLLDRIDLRVEVAPLPFEHWAIGGKGVGESTREIRARVARARQRQEQRLEGASGRLNSAISSPLIKGLCRPDSSAMALLEKIAAKAGTSARGLDRMLRVSRTIADLEGDGDVSARHVAEAAQYAGFKPAGAGISLSCKEA